MHKILRLILTTLTLMVAAAPVLADKFEAVHAVDYNSSEQARMALGSLMQDEAMKGTKVTLYALDFGKGDSSHLVVEDFDSYGELMSSREKRMASHGWTRYLLQASDAEYMGSQMIMVVDDHGKARRSAGYLVAYLIHTTDPAGYRSAIADLNKAVGNPGVMRLVAMRTGTTEYTHAVLIGGKDFKAVNEYMDKLYASDAFAEFLAKVRDTRKVVGTNMYRRIAVWGE